MNIQWTNLLAELDVSERQLADNTNTVRHESEGWIPLEKTLKRMQGMLTSNTTGRMGPFVAGSVNIKANDEVHMSSEELLQLINKILPLMEHDNRFVREGCFGVLELALVATNGPLPSDNGSQITKQLFKGLSDNWSQVRFRATHCTLAFSQYISRHDIKSYEVDVLLPSICLNRYYIAEGVREVTQKVWVALVGQNGRSVIASSPEKFVQHYVQQLKVKNHAVREAACHCIAELVVKIDFESVQPHVTLLISSLFDSFEDPSWPVRDAACLSASRMLEAGFNIELDLAMVLYKYFKQQSKDSVPTVRRNAGVALAMFYKSVPTERGTVLTDLHQMLLRIKDQPESPQPKQLRNVTEFGVAMQAHSNNLSAHSNKPMYSCGSMSPGPSTARVLGTGCSACNDMPRTEGEPWFQSDAALHAIGSIYPIVMNNPPDQFVSLLESIVITITKTSFIQYPSYWKTTCEVLLAILRVHPDIKSADWMIRLKNDFVVKAVESPVQLTSAAAESCLRLM